MVIPPRPLSSRANTAHTKELQKQTAIKEEMANRLEPLRPEPDEAYWERYVARHDPTGKGAKIIVEREAKQKRWTLR